MPAFIDQRLHTLGYYGDWHTHVYQGYYATELPSPKDLFEFGVMCDVCPIWRMNREWAMYLKPRFEKEIGRDSIPMSPRLQIIQPAHFGDMVVVSALEVRNVFQTLKEQDDGLANQRKQYRNYVDNVNNKKSIREDRDGYREIMKTAVATINEIIAGRATAEFIPHP